MTTVGIVGAGLIGTSIGLAAAATGFKVLLSDRDPEHIRVAEDLGAGQEWVVSETDGSTPVDLIVVAVPPSSAAQEIRRALVQWPHAVVTDVSSVKSPVVEKVAGAVAVEQLHRFVPGHPMAGREMSGPRAASAELFRGRPWLLCPTQATAASAVATVTGLVEATGAIAMPVPLALHDQMVAVTSHVPQVLSSLMSARLASCNPEALAVAGQGLRDVARLGASDPALWRDILTSNATEVLPVLREIAADLDVVLSDLDGAAEGERIEQVLRTGNQGSARLPAKHGGAAPEYAEVQVEVPDSPGALGALFLAAGDAGVNLEDVRIEHTVGRLTAIAHLYVLPEVVESLRTVLAASTWRLLD